MRVARTHFTERGLGNKNRAGFAQPGGHETVAPRHVILEQHRPHGGRHLLHIALILHGEGNAVQRADRAGLGEGGIEGIGLRQRFRVG